MHQRRPAQQTRGANDEECSIGHSVLTLPSTKGRPLGPRRWIVSPTIDAPELAVLDRRTIKQDRDPVPNYLLFLMIIFILTRVIQLEHQQ
jgi:hypothetical protein